MTTVGVRELKAHLSAYLARVKAGETVVITEHGRAIGRIEPDQPPPGPTDPTMARLAEDGVIQWNGERLRPPLKRISIGGSMTVSEMVIEDRGPR